MNIAIISRLDRSSSLDTSSGVATFIYTLTEELSKLEDILHIDVYGVGKNTFKSKKINYISVGPQFPYEAVINTKLGQKLCFYSEQIVKDTSLMVLSLKVYNLLLKKNYDLIHDNSTSLIFPMLAGSLPSPLISTMHTPAAAEIILIPQLLDALPKNKSKFITISHYQAKATKDMQLPLNIIGTVHNGIDLKRFKPGARSTQKYGLWIGRISAADNKGAPVAIRVAKHTAHKIILAGATSDQNFFDEQIKPLLGKKVDYINGRLSLKQKINLYQNSKYLLYPILWEEPFGLVMLEAMATGTPVIAYARGSVPEIIKDGLTGFIVNSSATDKRGDWFIKKTGFDGLVEAVNHIHSLSSSEYLQMRNACIAHAQNFSSVKMATNYLKLYHLTKAWKD